MQCADTRHTSFLNICNSAPPNTNHFLDHRKLLNPSSLILAGPVRTTVFLPGGGDGDKAEAELSIGNELEYADEEKLDLFPPPLVARGTDVDEEEAER